MDLAEWVQLTKIAESTAKVTALFIGGWWTWRVFIKNRLDYPKMTTFHELEHRVLRDDLRLVRLAAKLENCGDVLARITEYHATLYLVSPFNDEMKEHYEKNGFIVDLENTSGPPTEGAWPEIQSLSNQLSELEIEPKENDFIYFDFIIPADIETIVAYSYFRNQKKQKKIRIPLIWPRKSKGLGWSLSTMHDFKTDDTWIQQPPRTPQDLPTQPPKS